MKIAEIVPLKFLDYTKDNEYHMCLAQLVLGNKEYAAFYRRMSDEGKYVIVDNGACEGERLSFEELMTAYDIVNPTEIILPDVLFGGWETMERVGEFFTRSGGKISRFKKMLVPQGPTWVEWYWFLTEMSKEPYFESVTTIGIPKWLDSYPSPMRSYLCRMLNRDFPDKEIHLLGCNLGPESIAECREVNTRVRGCDSAFAYLCAKAGVEKICGETPRPGIKIDFLKDEVEKSPLKERMAEFEEIACAVDNKEK